MDTVEMVVCKSTIVEACNKSNDVKVSLPQVDVWVIDRIHKITYSFPLHKLDAAHVVTRSRRTARRVSFDASSPKVLYWTFPSGKKKIQWPEPLASRLISYLQDGGARYRNYDCGCFGEHMLGHTFSTPHTVWHMCPDTPIDVQALKPGEIVGTHSDEGVQHIIVAIGGQSGLFLSKFGSSGSLIVTDIDSAKRLFGSTHCSFAVRCSHSNKH